MSGLLPDFKSVLFPIDISYGAQSSSKFNTTIVTVASGYEKRIANWKDAMHEFNVSHNIKTEEQASSLKKLGMQMRGALISFMFKDWTDYKVNANEGIINEDGKLTGLPYLELWKKYEFTEDFDYYARRINLIIPEQEYDVYPFKVFIDGEETTEYNFNVDYDKGITTLLLNPIKTANIINISKEVNGIVTTSSPHNFSSIDKIYLKDIANGGKLNNKLFNITVIDSTHFYLNYDTTFIVGTATTGTANYYRQDDAVYTWQGEFYCNVRFGEDVATITIDDFGSFSYPCKLVELRAEEIL